MPAHGPRLASRRSRRPSFPLPPRLEGLRRLAYNLYWAWHPRTREPVEPDRPDGLDALPEPGPGDQRPDRVVAPARRREVPGRVPRRPGRLRPLHGQRLGPLVPAQATATQLDGPIAYFCAEYGLHESLGIYSGGLGVLAGDHMKSASDMALPFVGVGLLYRKGYFRQSIDADGHQEHAYPDYDLIRLPLAPRPGRERPAADRHGRAARPRPVGRRLARPGRPRAGPAARHRRRRRTRSRTGRSPTSCTSAAARCGSTRSSCWASAASARSAPSASRPAVWHLNEGHSAFLLAERARELVAGGRDARRRLGDGPARQRVHDPHAGLGRQRALRGRPRPARRRSAARRAAACPIEQVLELGRRHGRRPRPVRHDRVLACA